MGQRTRLISDLAMQAQKAIRAIAGRLVRATAGQPFATRE